MVVVVPAVVTFLIELSTTPVESLTTSIFAPDNNKILFLTVMMSFIFGLTDTSILLLLSIFKLFNVIRPEEEFIIPEFQRR